MGKQFYKALSPIRDILAHGRHIHPLLILFLDFFIVFFSFTLSYLIVGGFALDRLDFQEYSWYVGTFCLVAFPIIYWGKLHTGLLRYSNTIDLFRIFVTTLGFSFVFLIFTSSTPDLKT